MKSTPQPVILNMMLPSETHTTEAPDSTSEELLNRMAARLDTLLPPKYRESDEAVTPVSMGSAGLRFAPDGRVAWDQMWGSFCNLAMAGGPPHKGRLLQPPSRLEVEADPARYAAVTAEIIRGIQLVTGMDASPMKSGWVRVHCPTTAMAGWMLRAITMENVSVRGMGTDLELPAGPSFRLEKEIKNVITVTAKAAHYWQDHMPRPAQIAVAQLLMKMEAEHPLLAPSFTLATVSDEEAPRTRVAEQVNSRTRLPQAQPAYSGWVGFTCASVDEAIALMRLVVVANILVRREETVLYLPLNPVIDPRGLRTTEAICQAQAFLNRSSINRES